MRPSGKQASDRRNANRAALEVFSVSLDYEPTDTPYRTIHASPGPTLFTIGYERRTGDDLIAALRDAGVEVLVDVRQRPMSRKADFRGKALETSCADASLRYIGMPELGSTDAQRDRLKETGDFPAFARSFRRHVLSHAPDALDRLVELAKDKPVALLCYERRHEECHRSVIADLLAERDSLAVVAIG